MTDDEDNFLSDLIRRLSSNEVIRDIVVDIPYGILDQVNNTSLTWDEVDRIITQLLTLIRSLLEEANMIQTDDMGSRE